MPRVEGLTAKQERFVAEYLVDGNGTRAAIAAGYSERTAKGSASELLKKPKVIAALAAAKGPIMAALGIDAQNVLARMWDIATADPRKLIEYRRTCCRYCWGVGFRFQRTAGEMERDREAHAATQKKLTANPALFDEKGGTGYHAKRDVNPACEECFGNGVESAFIHDTRSLDEQTRRLYAGVKVTKEGVEVKMHSQSEALLNVGRHIGMFKDRLEHSGPDGAPLPPATVTLGLLTDDQLRTLASISLPDAAD